MCWLNLLWLPYKTQFTFSCSTAFIDGNNAWFFKVVGMIEILLNCLFEGSLVLFGKEWDRTQVAPLVFHSLATKVNVRKSYSFLFGFTCIFSLAFLFVCNDDFSWNPCNMCLLSLPILELWCFFFWMSAGNLLLHDLCEPSQTCRCLTTMALRT